jgi:hypothetical protein
MKDRESSKNVRQEFFVVWRVNRLVEETEAHVLVGLLLLLLLGLLLGLLGSTAGSGSTTSGGGTTSTAGGNGSKLLRAGSDQLQKRKKGVSHFALVVVRGSTQSVKE